MLFFIICDVKHQTSTNSEKVQVCVLLILSTEHLSCRAADSEGKTCEEFTMTLSRKRIQRVKSVLNSQEDSNNVDWLNSVFIYIDGDVRSV